MTSHTPSTAVSQLDATDLLSLKAMTETARTSEPHTKMFNTKELHGVPSSHGETKRQIASNAFKLHLL
jgi:hypothetical protein